MKKSMLLSILVMLLSFLVLLPKGSAATAQWSRKYQVSCSMCHAGFPRLNDYGERFMRNGYQDPDADKPDGGTLKKDKINKRLALEDITNHLGLRLNVDAIRYKDDSEKLSFGNAGWLQFFVAGSIAKNFSIFIENQVTTHSTHFSWYKLGFHNLGGSKAFNLTLGNQSPLDHSSFSNRLRILPAIKSDFFGVKPSLGLGEASVNASSARPGAQLFGDVGNFVYYTGISAGVEDGSLTSKDALNYWGGLRYNYTGSSSLYGSNVSLTYYVGTDIANGGTSDQIENDYYWWIPAVNIRVNEKFDLQAAARFGHEDNFLLATGQDVRDGDFDGWGLTAAYMINDVWQPALQYDAVNSGDIISQEKEWLTLGLSYFPLDQFRIAGYLRLDLADNKPNEQNEFFINMRVMF